MMRKKEGSTEHLLDEAPGVERFQVIHALAGADVGDGTIRRRHAANAQKTDNENENETS